MERPRITSAGGIPDVYSNCMEHFDMQDGAVEKLEASDVGQDAPDCEGVLQMFKVLTYFTGVAVLFSVTILMPSNRKLASAPPSGASGRT